MDAQQGYSAITGPTYEVFLDVGFGFCYASALHPFVRMLERHRTTSPGVLLIIRGFLTVVGLACLFGWYGFYLQAIDGHPVHPSRVLLDWVSLGLFAVGANWWDNQEHHEGLYCTIQAMAIAAFGTRCALAFWKLNHSAIAQTIAQPLIQAMFWCMILITCYVYGVILSGRSRRIFAHQGDARKQTCKIIIEAFFAFLVFAALNTAAWNVIINYSVRMSDLWSAFKVINYIKTDISAALIALGVVGYSAVSVSNANSERMFHSVLMTVVPLGILIAVTVCNRDVLFGGY